MNYSIADTIRLPPQLQKMEITWAQDYRDRMNPRLLTRLLRDAIPVLEHVDWKVIVVREGYCASMLPLNYESTNQHGTHQAALISMAADYTGGIALATLIRGVPFAGVHPGADEESAALWLAAMDVKFTAPSSGHLTVSCKIPAKECEHIQRRYYNGRRVLARLKVDFSSNDEKVSEAKMTYFAQRSNQIKPTLENPKVNTLYKHKLKASARLIAGLRGGLGGPSHIKTHCLHSRVAAGPHGQLLARRLNKVLPQLQDMVLARSQHIDTALLTGLQSGIKQVVLIGVGLDVRALHYGADALRATFYEVDLPEMLAERERVIRGLPGPSLQRKSVPMNFETESLHEVLTSSSAFEPSLPTAFIYEGCSMYFDESTNGELMSAVKQLMRNPRSFFWVDFVADAVVKGRIRHRDVELFLTGMEMLGEAFVFGVDDPKAFLSRNGFWVRELVSASDFFETSDPIFSLYRFTVSHHV